MTQENSLSIIVPIYNAELNLNECIQSLLALPTDFLEIILIDAGSTDLSGMIADKLAASDHRIKIIHQSNTGLASARNRGIEMAMHDYIAFIDTDDWIVAGQMEILFRYAIQTQADMVMENTLFYNQDKQLKSWASPIPEQIKNTLLNGKDCFTILMETQSYLPLPCNYLYRREWLKKNQLSFANLVHENELWTPLALCQANQIYIADVNFYGYRQRKNSGTNSLKNSTQTSDLITIANLLIRFAEKNLTGISDHEAAGQFYVKAFSLYKVAFHLLVRIRNSQFVLPSHYLYQLFNVYKRLPPQARIRCKEYYQTARTKLSEYLYWKISTPTAYIGQQLLAEKNLILVYNTMWDVPLNLPEENQLPPDFLYTTDRRFLTMAKAVVFHIPTLKGEIECSFKKNREQQWVAWSLECDDHYPNMKDPAFMKLFDFRMNYHPEADIPLSYIPHEQLDQFCQLPVPSAKDKNICMIISSKLNKSERKEYLKELMQYISIDSYGKLYNNKVMEHDTGRESKMTLYSHYKFVIAFENACSPDYVTEKFYDPLLAGSVPIYLGAPNIDEYAPGENCFINVRKYASPAELADFIYACCQDDTLYNQFFTWKKRPFLPSFIQKAEQQRINPFIRLCELIDS